MFELASELQFAKPNKMDTPHSQCLGSLSEAAPDQRREWRESLNASVEVSDFDVRGRFFTGRTSTLDVTESDCW
jgi:hypothetical protein